MTDDFTNEVTVVAEAITAVCENKQINKKNDISGDFSTDNESYPTAKAVKAELANYVTATALNTALSSYTTSTAMNTLFDAKVNISDIKDNLTSTDTNKPLSANQGKVLKGLVDGKVNTSDIKDNLTSTDTNKPLSANQGKVLKGLVDNLDMSSKSVVLNKLTGNNITTGMLATYEILQGGTSLGKIDIPKDFLVKSGQVKTVSTANSPVNGYAVGDKYIEFVINTKDNTGTDEKIYINVKDLVEDTTYTADNSTLELSAQNQFKIKNGGVGSDQIASSVKSTWLSNSDVESKISAFANALAQAINPSS